MAIDFKELYWAAGFLEGEGCFHLNNRLNCPVITCGQVDVEPLLRLQRLIGGTIHLRKVPKSGLPNAKRLSALVVNGVMAASWMMTLYPLLSTRRQGRIREALAAWKETPTPSGVLVKYLNRCRNGHDFTGDNIITAKSGKRRCRACAKAWQRQRKAKAEAPEPQQSPTQ